MLRFARLPLGICTLLLGLTSAATAADWPQWLGPDRTGASPETGLLTTWPAAGPKVLWKVDGGDGYSGIAVVGKRAYTMVQRDKGEFVIALDVADGKEVWAVRCGPAYKNQFGNGPRSTPAMDGKFVYAQAASGPFLCIDAEKGEVVWQHNLLEKFGAMNITWGLSASPLIDGDLVLTVPGGTGASAVAFNKKNGEVVWKVGDDKAAYASPVAVTVNNQRQAIFFTASRLFAVQMDSGKELWSTPWVTEFEVNISTPLRIGEELFVASGEKVGCVLFKLKGAEKPAVTWESKGAKSVMMTYWSNAVAHDKYLYGLSGEFNKAPALNCVELANGKEAWSSERFGHSALTLADGHLWILTAKGDLVLVPANPKGFEEKGRVNVLSDSKYATAPTIADKKLFMRDRKQIVCLDIAGK